MKLEITTHRPYFKTPPPLSAPRIARIISPGAPLRRYVCWADVANDFAKDSPELEEAGRYFCEGTADYVLIGSAEALEAGDL